MSERVEKAINYHKDLCSCSVSVACAFADETSLSENEIRSAVTPFAGGKMGKCGAVLAAEYILTKKYGEDAAKDKIAELERKFTEKNRSIMCRELKGSLTGKALRSCRGCVADAAELLDEILSEEE